MSPQPHTPSSAIDPRANSLGVAYQGEPGAYSELAALQHFGAHTTCVPKPTLPEVFDAVPAREVQLGLVPIENSVEGGVNETFDLLAETSLRLTGEVFLHVEHCFIGHRGTSLRSIRRVLSHPQALAQCRRFLARYSWERIPSYDTAGSVKLIGEKGWHDAAAIASARAAELYGMHVLRRHVEDSRSNYTRFLVLGRRDGLRTGRDKTSLLFTTKHRPGALHAALGVFAKRQLNLSMIVSRPTKATPWEYNFFVDCWGHRQDPLVAAAVTELATVTTFIKVLGSYRRAATR